MTPATPAPILVLVVDDSATARQAVRSVLEKDPTFRVATANDPYEAVEILRKTVPSVIVLDVDMPKMDGLTFLRKLMRQHPLPVLLCTDHPDRGLTGLEIGAREVIAKPDWRDTGASSAWGDRLREAVRRAVDQPSAELVTAQVDPRHSADVILAHSPFQSRGAPVDRVIAVGASTGGVDAIGRLLADVPSDSPGLVIVQHMPGGFTASFADRLNRDPSIKVEVAEARHEQPVRPGIALVVPGHAHGVLRRHGVGYRVDLVEGPPVSRHRPSVDVLFRSAAQAAGPRVASVLLTGMGDDGAQGLLEVREAGGHTIAQDEATCIVFGMPREAIRRGAAKQVLPLDRVAGAIAAWAGSGLSR